MRRPLAVHHHVAQGQRHAIEQGRRRAPSPARGGARSLERQPWGLGVAAQERQRPPASASSARPHRSGRSSRRPRPGASAATRSRHRGGRASMRAAVAVEAGAAASSGARIEVTKRAAGSWPRPGRRPGRPGAPPSRSACARRRRGGPRVDPAAEGERRARRQTSSPSSAPGLRSGGGLRGRPGARPAPRVSVPVPTGGRAQQARWTRESTSRWRRNPGARTGAARCRSRGRARGAPPAVTAMGKPARRAQADRGLRLLSGMGAAGID